jgi:Ca2+-binding RTX toxin-like protein
VLTVGAGADVNRSKKYHRDEELVQLAGLVDRIELHGGDDTVDGGTGNDLLTGDHSLSIAGIVNGPVIAGTSAARGFTSDYRFEAPLEIAALVDCIEVCGGNDTLRGGEGDDRAIGDGEYVITAVQHGAVVSGPAAFAAQVAFQHPFWEALVDFDGIVGGIESDAGNDILEGGAGDDELVGDDVLSVAAVIDGDMVVAQPGSASVPTRKTQDSALVEFDAVLGHADLHGGNDTLRGGDGDDLLAGDSQVQVVALQAGAVFAADTTLALSLAASAGRLSNEAQADFDRLADCITLCGGDDTLTGGAGGDVLVGDHQASVTAVVVGPLVRGQGGSLPTTLTGSTQCEALVEFDSLLGSLNLQAGRDSLSGESGDDRIIGDSQAEVVAVLDGTAGQAPSGGGPLPTLTTSGTTALPAAIDLVSFERMLDCLTLGSACDTLNGGDGADQLIGDSSARVKGAVIGGDSSGADVSNLVRWNVEFASLVGGLSVSGSADTLLGGAGDDCLIGDNQAEASVVVAGDQPAGAVRIEVHGLVDDLNLCAGGDRLEGGSGNDRLVGDHDVALTGIELQGVSTLGGRSIDVDGLACSVRMDAGCDTLLAGDGNDLVIGDQLIDVTGVRATAQPTSAGSGTALLEVDALTHDVHLGAGADTIDAGNHDDEVYGDQFVTLTAVRGSLAQGGLSIETDCTLLDCVDILAAGDRLTGGEGSDRIVGDSRVQAAGMAGSVAAGSAATVMVERLARQLYVGGGDDQAWGNAGDDVLIGDNRVVLAGLVLDNAVGGSLRVEVDGLFDGVTVDGGKDTFDGGDGNDSVIGDQALAMGALMGAAAAGGSGAGNVSVDVHELAACVELKAQADKLYGGKGNDFLLGDSHTVLAGYLGSFASPLAAGIQITGDRLVCDIDVRAGGDTLRGGDGEDTLVGDSDTIAAVAAPGTTAPAGTFGLDDVAVDLSVAAGNDSVDGEAGNDVQENGNRAVTPSALVDRASVSSKSSTGVPAAGPSIDWNAKGICEARPNKAAGWTESFVNGLGGANLNGKIRIKL